MTKRQAYMDIGHSLLDIGYSLLPFFTLFAHPLNLPPLRFRELCTNKSQKNTRYEKASFPASMLIFQ